MSLSDKIYDEDDIPSAIVSVKDLKASIKELKGIIYDEPEILTLINEIFGKELAE